MFKVKTERSLIFLKEENYKFRRLVEFIRRRVAEAEYISN